MRRASQILWTGVCLTLGACLVATDVLRSGSWFFLEYVVLPAMFAALIARYMAKYSSLSATICCMTLPGVYVSCSRWSFTWHHILFGATGAFIPVVVTSTWMRKCSLSARIVGTLGLCCLTIGLMDAIRGYLAFPSDPMFVRWNESADRFLKSFWMPLTESYAVIPMVALAVLQVSSRPQPRARVA